MTTSPTTLDSLVEAMISPQLSEEEALSLFDDAHQEYRMAKEGDNLITPETFITPRAWWLV